jgi:hypothetical protein
MSTIEEIKEAIESRKKLLEIQREGYEQVEYLGEKIGNFDLYKTYIEVLSVVFRKLISDKNLKIHFDDLAINKKWLDGIGQLQDILIVAYPMLNDEKSDPLFMGYLYVKFYHSGFGHAINFFRRLAVIINKKYKYIKKDSKYLTDKNCIDILIKYEKTYGVILVNFDTEIRNCIAHEDYVIDKNNTIEFLMNDGRKIRKSFADIGLMFSSFSILNNALIFVVAHHEIRVLERHLKEITTKK